MQGELVDGKGEMWHSLAHHTIMFSLLADKLDNTFRRLRGLGKISEKNIADALRDIIAEEMTPEAEMPPCWAGTPWGWI